MYINFFTILCQKIGDFLEDKTDITIYSVEYGLNLTNLPSERDKMHINYGVLNQDINVKFTQKKLLRDKKRVVGSGNDTKILETVNDNGDEDDNDNNDEEEDELPKDLALNENNFKGKEKVNQKDVKQGKNKSEGGKSENVKTQSGNPKIQGRKS